MRYAIIVILSSGIMGFGSEVWPDFFLEVVIAISAVSVIMLMLLKDVNTTPTPQVEVAQKPAPAPVERQGLTIEALRMPVLTLAFKYLNEKILDFRVWHISKGDQMDVHRAFVSLRRWLPHQMEIDFLMTDHEEGRFVNNYDLGHAVNQLIRSQKLDPATEKINFAHSFDLIICQYPLSQLTEAKRLATVGKLMKVLCAGGFIYFPEGPVISQSDLLGLEPMGFGFFRKTKGQSGAAQMDISSEQKTENDQVLS